MSDSASAPGGRLHSLSDRSDDWYETVLEVTSDGVYQTDLAGRFVAVNDVVLEETGYDADELLGEHASILIDDESVRAIEEGIRRLLDGTIEGNFTRTATVQTADGEQFPIEMRIGLLREGEEATGIVGVVRDVTGRRQRRQELRERTSRAERERDDLRAELDEILSRVTDAVFALDERFRFTYVNEHAAEYLDHDESELLGEHIREVFPSIAETPFWDRYREALATQQPAHFEAYFDPMETWFETHVYPSESGLSVYFRDVTERKESEQQLAAHRERLATLNDVNRVLQDVSHALVGADSREEIERVVTERLAAAETFAGALFGEVDAGSARVRTAAGVEPPMDDEHATPEAVARAARTGTVQVVDDALADPAYEPWREHARERGYRSVAAVPASYEGVRYGVLSVYADETGAFEGDVECVVSRLGEMVGHAINALDRKRALVGDEVTELEIRVPDILGDSDVDPDGERIEFESVLPTGDGTYAAYGSTSETGIETLRAIEAELPHWRNLTVRDGGEDARFALETREPPLASLTATLGGRVADTVLEGDALQMTVQLPYDVDVREYVEQIREEYPGTEVVAQRRTGRSGGSVDPFGTVVDERLTDRQRTALEAAYVSGFFEWPRDCTGEEVAESMGVSPATFHQHLREAQRRIVTELFDSLSQ